MRVVTAAKMILTNPRGAWHRIHDLASQRATIRRLQRSLQREGTPVWIRYGEIEFPYFGDGDLQESYYHTHFDEWYAGVHAAFGKYVRAGNVAVDVGANMGFLTLVLAHLVGLQGRVHSFEPSSAPFEKLGHVVRRNRFDNVVLHQCGLGEKREQLSLATPQASGNASLVCEFGVAATRQLVSIEQFDSYLGGQLDRLDFLKVDTEGFEIHVLRGAQESIERFRPVVFIELASDFRESSEASIAWLKERGYKFPVEPDLQSARNGANFFAIPTP
jgi:FkbM family methyltransferase